MTINPDDTDQIFILWQDIVFSGGSHGGEIFFSRSIDGGITFDEPVNLSNTKAGAGKGRLNQTRWDNGSLDLAMGPGGNLYAAWTEYEGALHLSRSTDLGRNFTDPVHIAGDGDSPARGPALAVDQEGTIHIAWTIGEDESAGIRYAVSTDQGDTFNAPRIVNESIGHSDAPRIAVDSKGTVHLVYSEGSGYRFTQYQVRYTRKFHDASRFEEPRTVSGRISRQGGGAAFPDLALDNKDNLYLVWELYPDSDWYSLGLGFTNSNDSGSGFSEPGTVPGSADPEYGVNGSRQGSLMSKLSVSGSGNLAVVNSTFRSNDSSHIWIFQGESGL
jgi:hypothetical protein